jgi:hypothetical protein
MSEDDVLELELELGEGDAGWDDEEAGGVEVGSGWVAGGDVGLGVGVSDFVPGTGYVGSTSPMGEVEGTCEAME